MSSGKLNAKGLEAVIKSTKEAASSKKVSDGGGMYLEITKSGGTYWRMKYRFLGKEKRFAIGVYPEVSLKEAREKRDEARKLLSVDIDPSAAKQAAKQELKTNHANIL